MPRKNTNQKLPRNFGKEMGNYLQKRDGEEEGGMLSSLWLAMNSLSVPPCQALAASPSCLGDAQPCPAQPGRITGNGQTAGASSWARGWRFQQELGKKQNQEQLARKYHPRCVGQGEEAAGPILPVGRRGTAEAKAGRHQVHPEVPWCSLARRAPRLGAHPRAHSYFWRG